MKTTTRIFTLIAALSFALIGCDSSTSKIPQEQLESSGEFDVPTEQTDGQGKPVVEKVADILEVDAGRQQFSDPNLLVKLRGAVDSRADGQPAPVEAVWTQVEDGAPRAFIVSPNQLETLILAPDVSERTKLTFQLTGTNAQGNTSRDTTSLYVSPNEGGSYIYVVSTVVDEDANEVVFTLKLRSPAQQQVSFSFDTEGQGGVVSATALQGLDYQPFSGTITFAPGEQIKQIAVPLLDDDTSEGNEFFNLLIKDQQTQNLIVNGVAILKDNELQPSFPTTIPLNEGPSDQTQEQAGGTPGVVRGILDWENPNSQLELILRFTGENGECDIRLSSAQEEAQCDDRLGIFEASPNRSEIIWPDAAPAGFYRFIVQHLSGETSDYNLRLFIDDESLRFSGTIAEGASVEVYAFDFEGAIREPSSSSQSTESSSDVSSDLSTSSFADSSSVESSSSLASSTQSSSSEQSSSEQSSTAQSSSQASSSSLPKPERDLLVQFDGVENPFISSPAINISGLAVFDPLFPVDEVVLAVDFQNSESSILEIPLGQSDFDPETGEIEALVNLDIALYSSRQFRISLLVRDTAGREAFSDNSAEITFLSDPSIYLDLPENRTYFGGQVEVRGRVEVDSRSPIADVVLYIQGPGEDSPQAVQMGVEAGEFFWFLPDDLPLGGYSVWSTVTDASGQTATSATVNFDYALAGAINVSIEQPEESLLELYPGATSDVVGQITQTANLPIASASINISRLVGDGVQEPVSDINLLGSEFWNPETQAFNFLLDPQAETLTEGFYNLFINASDSAGNAGDASFSFEYFTPIQPSLTVEAPIQTTYVLSVPVSAQAIFDERLQATLSGEVTLEDELVETLAVPLTQNSIIDMQIDTLSPGTYGLSLSLQDSAGQTSIVDDLSFSVRAPIQPLIQIETPETTAEPEIVFENLLPIDGSLVLDDTASVSALSLTLNHFNSESAFELELDLLAAGALDGEGNSFEYLLNFEEQGIENGLYRGSVELSDSYGNSATGSFSFEYYSPVAPTVQWLNVPEGRYADVVPVDFSAVVTWDERLFVSAEAVWTRSQGEGSSSDIIPLQVDAQNVTVGALNPPSEPGQYSLYIQVEDSRGQTAQTSEVSFEVYAAEGPVISIETPELLEGVFTTVKPQLTVQGSVALEPNTSLISFDFEILQGDLLVEQFTLLGDDLYDPDSGDFSVPLNLSSLLEGFGALTIRLVAEDSLGLENELNFLVNYEQPDPTSINITSPIEGEPYFTTPLLTGYFEIDPRLTYRRIDFVLLYDGDETDLNTNDLVLDGPNFNADLGNLPPGDYLVYVEIEDELGDIANTGVNFRIRPVVDLALEWINPTPQAEPYQTLGPVLDLDGQFGPSGIQVLDLEFFPDGTPVSDNEVLTDQYRDAGILINARRPEQPQGSLNAIAAGPSGGRYFFFSPDIDGAIASFEFVDPGTDSPTNATLFRAVAGWSAGESITLVTYDQDGQMLDSQTFNSPNPGNNILPGVVEITGDFHRVEMHTDGNPGIGITNIAYDIGNVPQVSNDYLSVITQSLELEITALSGETTSINLLDAERFDFTTGRFGYGLNFDELALANGIYELRVVAGTTFGVLTSDTLSVQYIDALAPELNLTAPVQGVYFSGIDIEGTVEADSSLLLEATATLQLLNSESPAVDVPVVIGGNALTGFIEANTLTTGTYRLDIFVEDQFDRPSEIQSVVFDYAVPQATIDIFAENSDTFDAFGTGVGSSGNLLAAGEQDSRFTILETQTNAVTLTSPYSDYIPNTQNSQWVWENANSQPINVTRTFRTTFELNQQNPSDVLVYGRWSVDNTGLDILINGQSTGYTASGYTTFYDFYIRSGLVQGTNTLDFVVQDVGGVSAFRAELVSLATALIPGDVIETVGPFDLYSRVQLSHPQLGVNNFVLEVLQAGQWVEQQIFSTAEVEWDGENANFTLDYSELGYGSYPSRIRVNYGSGFSEVSGVFNVGYRQTESPTVEWLNSPAGFYLSAEGISFSAQATVDEALNVFNARVIVSDANTGAEVRVLTDFGVEGQAFFGSLDEALAEGDYLWTFEITDSFNETATSESVLVQVREPDDLLLVLQSPILENGEYASVNPSLNIAGEVRHDENTSLEVLQLRIEYDDGEGGSLVVDADLIDLNLYDAQTGTFSYNFDVNDFDFGAGYYYVTLSALDGVNNSETLLFNFLYSDAQTPELEIINPLQQLYFDVPRLEGRYSVDPELTVKEFTAVLQYAGGVGSPVPVDFNLVLETAEGGFSADLPPNIPAGNYTILINLTDELNNPTTSSVDFEYFIADPTVVELSQPVAEEGDYFTIRSLIPFSGSVTLDDFVTLQSLTAVLVTPTGQEFEQDLLQTDGALQGSFFSGEWDLDILDLSSGRYELYTRAATNVDEVTSNSLFVEYLAAEQPTVEIIAPNASQTYYSDIPFTALATYDDSTSIVVNAQYRAINGDATSPVLEITVDGQNIDGVIPVAGLLPGQYELSVFIEDGFDQPSEVETVQFNYQIPSANINLIHNHPDNDGVVDLIDTLYVEAEITLEDPEQPINSLSVQLLGEGGWYTVDTYENLDVLDWDGTSAFVNFDFAAHDFLFGVYDWRIQIIYGNNLVASSDPLRVNYRDIEPIQLIINQPSSDNYFEPAIIQGSLQGDPLLDVQLNASLFEQSAESEQALSLTRNGESFSAPAVSEPGDYLLEVYANYPGQDPVVAEVAFNIIDAVATLELTHQMPVFDGAIDAVDPLFLVGNVTLSDDRILVDGFAIEILQGEQWVELQNYTTEQADFGGNQAYFSLDLRQYNLAIGEYDLRARMDYANTRSVYSQPVLVNYRDLSPFTVEIVSPQNGFESEQAFDLSVQYATDRLAAPVQLSGRISNEHDEGSLNLPAIPLFEQFAGQFSFEIPADSLRWGENRISIGGLDYRDRPASPSVITVNYLLSSPQVEIIGTRPESEDIYTEGFSLLFDYALDEKLPAPDADENAQIIVAINDNRVEKSAEQTSDGLWQLDFSADDFSEGDQTILITVIDPRDNNVQGSVEYSFEFNHRPQVIINSPLSVNEQDLPYFTDVDVEFEASIGTDGQVATMDVYLNGGEYLVQQSAQSGVNRFTIPADDLIWGDGEFNELGIQVFSANGVASNLSSVVFEYYRPVNPTVVIEEPIADEGGVPVTYSSAQSFSGVITFDPALGFPTVEAFLLEPDSDNVLAQQDISNNVEFDIGSGSGSFKAAFQLDEEPLVDFGRHLLRVVVTDSIRNPARDEVEIDYFEASQPTVEILNPNAGSTVDTDFTVVADIEWQRPLSAIISAQLTSVDTTLNTRIELDLQIDEGGYYSTQVPTAELESGDYNIFVSVEDSNEQTAEQEIQITYREPAPLLVELAEPEEVNGVVSTVGPNIDISGYVFHDLDRPVTALELSFDPEDPNNPTDPLQGNLKWGPADEEGVVYFSTQINLRNMEASSGTYNLAVTATDELTRQSRDSVVVRYRVPEPTRVDILSPRPVDETLTGNIYVEVQTVSDQDVTVENVYGEIEHTDENNNTTITPFDLQTQNSEIGLIYVATLGEDSLKEGDNTITVYAEDSLADTPQDAVTVSYRYTQPTQITAVEGQNSSAQFDAQVEYEFDVVNAPATLSRTLVSDQYNVTEETVLREADNSGTYYDSFYGNDLYIGGNTIRYTIVDASGTTLSEELTYTHVINGPFVSVQVVNPNDIEFGQAFDLSARVWFDSALPEVQTANGILASLTVNDAQPRQVTMVPDEGNNLYRLTVNPSWVDPGINNITLEVCDPRVEPNENTCITRGAEFEINAELDFRLVNPLPEYEYHQFDPPVISGDVRINGESIDFDLIVMYETDENGIRTNRAPVDLMDCFKTLDGCVQDTNGLSDLNFREIVLTKGNAEYIENFTFFYRELDAVTLDLSRIASNNVNSIAGDFRATFSFDPRIDASELTLFAQFRDANGNTQDITLPAPNFNSGRGSVTFTVDNQIVALGQNTVAFELTDGNSKASDSASFNFNAPIVNIISPREQPGGIILNGDTVTIEFAVEYSGDVQPSSDLLPNFRLYHSGPQVVGAQADTNQQGLWRTTVDISNYAAGSHGLGIEVGDFRRPDISNSRTDSSMRARFDFTIPEQIQPPVVSIVRPDDGAELPFSPNGTFNVLFGYEYSDGAIIERPDYEIVINNGDPITNIPIATANGTNRYEVALSMAQLERGAKNQIEVRVADHRDDQIIGSTTFVVTLPEFYPPQVSIATPASGEVRTYDGFNLIFSREYDNTGNDEMPINPDYVVRVNGQTLDGLFGTPGPGNVENGYAVVMPRDIYRIGSNTIELTVFDYRDESISTTVTRNFVYTPADLEIELQNVDGSILPLSGGDVVVNITSRNVELSSATIFLDGERLENVQLDSNRNQGPYGYTYILPRSQITPGLSELEIQAYTKDSRGWEGVSAVETTTMSYRDPTADITSVSGRIWGTLNDPGGSVGGARIYIYYRNQEIAWQGVRFPEPGENVSWNTNFDVPVDIPSGDATFELVYQDSSTGKELFRKFDTVRVP